MNRQRRLSHGEFRSLVLHLLSPPTDFLGGCLSYGLVDEITKSAPRRFLIDVEETLRLVLEQEDTDGDFQVRPTRLSSFRSFFSREGVKLMVEVFRLWVDLHHRLWSQSDDSRNSDFERLQVL